MTESETEIFTNHTDQKYSQMTQMTVVSVAGITAAALTVPVCQMGIVNLIIVVSVIMTPPMTAIRTVPENGAVVRY